MVYLTKIAQWSELRRIFSKQIELCCVIFFCSSIGYAVEVKKITLPDSLAHVVPHAKWPEPVICQNLRYEGNNLDARGELNEFDVYRLDGAQIANGWKHLLENSRGVFALRDSLFSQQDHPISVQQPRAIMLPPNWISAFVFVIAQKHNVKLPNVPTNHDEKAWTALTLSELFGDMPRSETLFSWVTKNSETSPQKEKSRILNARESMIGLRDLLIKLQAASSKGIEEVARVGGEMIVQSDEAYFGAKLRREKLIPIFVENPTPFERQEGKGLDPSPEIALPPQIRKTLIKKIYGARLARGDLALERYDLSNENDRKRAINLAQILLNHKQKTKLWIWVTGRLDPDKKLQGENATAYVAKFNEELRKSKVNMQRIQLMSKPVAQLPQGSKIFPWMNEEAKRYQELGLPLSVSLTCEQIVAGMDVKK